MSVFGTAFSWSDNTSTFADGCTNNLSAEFKSYFAANGTYNGLCMPSDHAYLADCSHPWFPCNATNYTGTSGVHDNRRYKDSSVAWVLIAAIIVFFMKAGFMLLEIAFAKTASERRIVVIYKYVDAFASALGFFLIGYDYISVYKSPQCIQAEFFSITDPVLWFFKFTFASNAATILGGCLVTNKYKLRLPAVFLSAFVISGIIHPTVAFFIWTGNCDSYSPYRFCQPENCDDYSTCKSCRKSIDCTSFTGKAYFLDFAGGGAVHLLGGTAGLMVCLFAKLQKYLDKRKKDRARRSHPNTTLSEPKPMPNGFWEWMYPPMAGEENVEMAALGVLILWFSWFAFNCGSTESVESGQHGLYHAVPSRIAINMILSCSAGGVLSVIIACRAQLHYQTDSINANEISNGVLSCLVAITAGCPFVEYWQACLIGIIAVIFYHLGCYAEYKLGIEDTARVVPVHGVCGLWSLLAVGFFLQTNESLCYLHATFEGLCFCNLRLPYLKPMERIGAQVIGSLFILALGLSTGIVYGILYIIPIQPFADVYAKIICVKRLQFSGGFLLTSPLDGTPFEQEDQQPLIELLSKHQDYGATTSTPPVTDQSPELPRQTPNSDYTRSIDSNDISIQSQTCGSQPRSRAGPTSLTREESHSRTLDSNF